MTVQSGLNDACLHEGPIIRYIYRGWCGYLDLRIGCVLGCLVNRRLVSDFPLHLGVFVNCRLFWCSALPSGKSAEFGGNSAESGGKSAEFGVFIEGRCFSHFGVVCSASAFFFWNRQYFCEFGGNFRSEAFRQQKMPKEVLGIETTCCSDRTQWHLFCFTQIAKNTDVLQYVHTNQTRKHMIADQHISKL